MHGEAGCFNSSNTGDVPTQIVIFVIIPACCSQLKIPSFVFRPDHGRHMGWIR